MNGQRPQEVQPGDDPLTELGSSILELVEARAPELVARMDEHDVVVLVADRRTMRIGMACRLSASRPSGFGGTVGAYLAQVLGLLLREGEPDAVAQIRAAVLRWGTH